MMKHLPLIALLLLVGCKEPVAEPTVSPELVNETPADEAERFEASYPATAERLAELEKVKAAKVESCPAPQFTEAELKEWREALAQWKADCAKHAEYNAKMEKWNADVQENVRKRAPEIAPGTPVNSTIDKARANGHCAVLICRQTICGPCDDLERGALASTVYRDNIEAGEFDTLTVNIDNDPATQRRFQITRTPTVVVYDPSINKWHPAIVGGKISGEDLVHEINKAVAILKDDAPATAPAPGRLSVPGLLRGIGR